MGSDKAKDRQASDDELPQHELHLPAFGISKYPITNAQYQAFVSDGGYQKAAYWPEAIAAKCWQPGLIRDWQGERSGPVDFGHPFNLPNHPVVGLTWYEAVAFCRWLTNRLQSGGELAPEQAITLPSEAEWEKAARGPTGRIFPWGDEPDPNKANYDPTGIGTTSAVGCFPAGASPYGCLDLAGNVGEWTQSSDEGYPYNQADSREESEKSTDVRRVLRGGAFDDNENLVRCAARLRDFPDNNWYNYLGVRVVVSPFFTSGL